MLCYLPSLLCTLGVQLLHITEVAGSRCQLTSGYLRADVGVRVLISALDWMECEGESAGGGAGVGTSRIDVLTADGLGSIIGSSGLGSARRRGGGGPAAWRPLQASAAQEAAPERSPAGALVTHTQTHTPDTRAQHTLLPSRPVQRAKLGTKLLCDTPAVCLDCVS